MLWFSAPDTQWGSQDWLHGRHKVEKKVISASQAALIGVVRKAKEGLPCGTAYLGLPL